MTHLQVQCTRGEFEGIDQRILSLLAASEGIKGGDSIVDERMQPIEPSIVDQFEALLHRLGLTFERLSLKKNPNGIHWHIRMPNKKGTLEANWDPRTELLWLEVRPNRSADWQPPLIELLKIEIQNSQSRSFLSEETRPYND